ncbi:MAG: DUF2442 domain-containing protein [Prevotellaceae bacterium]|jgi:hypothetical protein|nr:DUF2442 domain-containing protein [Prevotellaceae bacterium]
MIAVKNIEIGAEDIILHTEKGNGHYPFSHSLRLKNATPEQRGQYSLSPFGIHWKEFDEDLCFDGFIFNQPINDKIRLSPI